ncbi:MAG: alpha/beta hydrolase-fold protein, partial [Bacteroidota bacterium]
MDLQRCLFSGFLLLSLFRLMAFQIDGEPIRLVLESEPLNTQTEVWIHQLQKSKAGEQILYFTDGRKLLDQGYLDHLEALSRAGKMSASYLVFVGTVDLKDQVDKRNDYFFCNPSYVDFFEQELIPRVEDTIGRSFQAEDRALIGVSFGGLNAAWFSAKSRTF